MLRYVKKLSGYLIIIFILFFFGNNLIVSANNQEESSFVIRILNSETRDQNSYLKIEKIGKHWGTGFFVSFENELYVVTARHVADQKYDLIGIARIKNNETGEIEKYKLFPPVGKIKQIFMKSKNVINNAIYFFQLFKLLRPL